MGLYQVFTMTHGAPASRSHPSVFRAILFLFVGLYICLNIILNTETKN
nr:MAG TPA: Spermatid maturation protein 1 [Caudoviricetes sp.]